MRVKNEVGFVCAYENHISSSERRTEFVSDRVSYLYYEVASDMVLNVHAPTQDKINVKASIYNKLLCLFNTLL